MLNIIDTAKLPQQLQPSTLYRIKIDPTKISSYLTDNNGTVILKGNATSNSIDPVVKTALDTKVDKVKGKDLSSNDFTTAHLNKLNGIATGATKNAADSFLLDRRNHTGSQAIETITDLRDNLDGKLDYLTARFADSEEALQQAMNDIPDQKKIFDSWYRFSHNASNNYPANPNELTAWTFDTATNSIINTTNSGTTIGVVSPNSYSDYELLVRVTSTERDDDMIGIVIAFHKDPVTGKEYTLSLTRSPGGIQPLYGLVYNFSGFNEPGDQRTLVNGNGKVKWGNNKDGNLTSSEAGYTGSNPGWGDMGAFQKTGINGCLLKVIRNGDTITAYTSQWNNPNVIDESTKLELNLASNSLLSVFNGAKQYGLTAMSQARSSWDILSFTNPQDALYDITTGKGYIYQGGKWAEIPNISLNNIKTTTLLVDNTNGDTYVYNPGGVVSKFQGTLVSK